MKDINVRTTNKRAGILHHIFPLMFLGIMIIAAVCVIYDSVTINAKQALQNEYVTSNDWIAPAVIH